MTDSTHDIVDTAVAAGSFKTLVAAVTAADLVDTLKGAGPFTVFAPSDDAFAALPTGTVEDLVKPENKDKLTAILLLHVLPGKVMANDVTGKVMDPATAGGATVHVDGTDGVTVNGSKVHFVVAVVFYLLLLFIAILALAWILRSVFGNL